MKAGTRTRVIALSLALLATPLAAVEVQSYALPAGAHPHDVAPAPEVGGPVWYTAQHQGALGRLDPASGVVLHIPLGAGSRPHGVIIGPDGAPWVTDGGLNAIVRVDPKTHAVRAWPLPEGSGYANLNTAAFDGRGKLWFTGQSGIYGSLDPASGEVKVWPAPRGRGPYGITATPSGDIWYASLAGSHIAHIDTGSGVATIIEPPTPGQGARRVWSDAKGRIWVSEWLSGQLGRYDPTDRSWREWPLPGSGARTYAVYVDDTGAVWMSDFGANAMLRLEPASETFESFPGPRADAAVRQILGRAGEVWAPESGTDHLVVYRTR